MGNVRGCLFCIKLSLSARRAWIEISYGALAGASEMVALRKESVDRNNRRLRAVQNTKSLSARRAWIEMAVLCLSCVLLLLSLSARRAWIEMPVKFGLLLLTYRRSPQGERG